MKKQRTSYSFLMEMLWVCGFFALAACIFVLAFVKADGTSKGADALNHAVLAAQNAVETTYASYDPSVPTGTRELLFDRNWNEIVSGSGTPAFLLTLTASAEDGMLTVKAEVTKKGGTSIYTLDSARCLPPERGRP